jgi:regulator of nucleoside diphosphate kinase
MLLLTTESLPIGLEIKEMFSMVQITKPVEISSKGVIRGLLEAKKNEYQEALEMLAQVAPSNANAIVGIKVTTSTQSFSNGTFLYITYIGTPVIYGEIGDLK